MIHVLDFNGNIIDFISSDDNVVIHANHYRNLNERSETYNLTILSDRATHFMEKNRVIIQDSNEKYREFIISHIESLNDGYTEVEMSASYLEDISTAKPIPPGKYEKMTTSQALDEVLKDTGWQRSEETEYGGIRTTSWTSYRKRYEVLLQLCTTYSMTLDFYIVLGSNRVKGRYVSLKEKNPLFKGKEIVKGKDLVSMKRVVQLDEIRTGLLCIGPQRDDGSRIEVTVTDDEAQEQFGLPNRYIWDIYEPESNDNNMTVERLKTLGKTELNKRKVALISYEVTAFDIKKENPHEIVNLGDKVRIKDRDFNPPLYVEAEVIGEEYDPISKDSIYKFGQYKEYNENDLRAEFNKKLYSIHQKLNDSINNSNTIITNRIAEEVERLQKVIHRGTTPPSNPEEGDFWYDTTNPNVAVLREFVDGIWRNASAHDVEQIGGMKREAIMYNEINGTYLALSVQHAKITNETYESLNSEYLVDEDARNWLNNELNSLNKIYDSIGSSVNSMTSETATIGKLMDTQSMIVQYRAQIYALNNALLNAKMAIDKRFKLLQSQYTDEKYTEAMQKIADVINGTYNPETGQLVADIPNKAMLEEMRMTIENAMNEMSQANEAKLQELQNGITQTNQRITNTKEELSVGITSVTQKVNGLQVDGKNLIRSFFSDSPMFEKTAGTTFVDDTKATLNSGQRINIKFFDEFKNTLLPNTDYTLRIEESSDNIEIGIFYNRGSNIVVGYANVREIQFNTMNKENIMIVIKSKATNQFVNKISLYRGLKNLEWSIAPEDTQLQIERAQTEALNAAKAYADAQDELKSTEIKAYADGIVDAEEQRAIDDARAKLEQAKIYAEQKATDAKNAAISDSKNQLNPIKTTIQEQNAEINLLKEGIKLKADKNEVTKIYNQYLTPLQTAVNKQKATLDLLPSQIAQKVSKTEYTANMENIVNRLNNAEAESVVMANQIKNRVTLKEYNNMKIGTENLLLNSGFRNIAVSSSTHSYFGYDLTKPLKVGKTYTFTCDFNTTDTEQSGKTSVRGFKPDNGLMNVDINDNKINVTFVAKAASTSFLIYKDVAGASSNTLNVNITKAMLVEGDKAGDYQQAPREMAERLSTMETNIAQNGQQINLKASKEELNKSKKTLSHVLADLTINTTDGLTLSYDENGSITSHVVGPNGVKIRGDKVDIRANREFKVIADNIDNKVGKNDIVNSLNLSTEGLDINVNRIGIKGGNSNRYVQIQNDSIELGGIVQRTWRGKLSTDDIFTRLKDGHLRFRNNSAGGSLYMSHFGISTYIDGEGENGGSSGTIQWWDKTYSESGMNGITVNSHGGVVALSSDYNRIVLDAYSSANIQSKQAPIYLYPKTDIVPGLNRFAFTLSDADSAYTSDGYIMFGSDENYDYGAGIRFSKQRNKGLVQIVDGKYATGGNTTIEAGYGKFNEIKRRDGNSYVRIQSYDLLAVGSDGAGDRVASKSIYRRTYSSPANVHITSEGTLGRATSASKYKLAIKKQYDEFESQYDHSKQILNLDLKTWYDKSESEIYAQELESNERLSDDKFLLKRHAGLIAEDVENVGLTEFVTYDYEGEIEGIQYDRLWIHLIPIIKRQQEKIEHLEGIINEQ